MSRRPKPQNTESGRSASPVSVPCVHCGLPSPPPSSADDEAFCCSGCRGAYHLIRGWGLDDYYALRDRLGTDASTASMNFDSGGPSDAVSDLDVTETLGESAPVDCGNGLKRSRLAVSGLHCGACAWLIEKSAARIDGWVSARVRMVDHTVEVIYAPDQLPLSRIGVAMGKLGYRVAPLVENDRRRREASEQRKMITGIAVAGFCAANSMWIAAALYAGMFSGIASSHATAFRYAGMALGATAVLFPGRVFFRGAWASLVTRTPHMDLPVALGLAVGLVAGIVSTVTGVGEVYFDSIATLTFFLLLGRWVQFRQQRRASESVTLLMRLTPRIATRVDSHGTARRVSVSDLAVGDVIRVLAGETIPVDGVITDGRTEVDRSLVSGESRALVAEVGDAVLAGCANLQSTVEVRTTATGEQTRVGRIGQMIADSATHRAPVVQMADSIGGKFVVVVMGIAAATVIGWWNTSPQTAAQNAVALLIVACPCALALATPLALSVAIGRSAARSILVRGSDVMDTLGRAGGGAGVIWFDKTGTLTVGRPTVQAWTGDEASLAMLAAAESTTQHPVADAVVRYAQERQARPGTGGTEPGEHQFMQKHDVGDVVQVTGSGITATVSGRRLVAGKPDFVARHSAAGPAVAVDTSAIDAQRIDAQIASMIDRGASPMVVAIDSEVVGVAGIQDALRPDAAVTIGQVRELGWKVGILSGDHESTVQRIAASLQIDPGMVHAGMEPEQKLAFVRRRPASDSGSVVMVGDGVNDAAALAAADVGIAVRGGAAASLEAAPVFLATGQLALIPKLMAAARRTRRTIVLNFGLSLGYNAIAVILAAGGWINPLVAAILMPISSLTVLAVVWSRRTYV